jgi:hypothetical protein
VSVRSSLGLALIVSALATGPAVTVPARAATLPGHQTVHAMPERPRPRPATDKTANKTGNRGASKAAGKASNKAKPGGVQVGITSIGTKPWVTDGDKVTFSGTLSNYSGQAIPRGAQIQLSYAHTPVNSRGELSSPSQIRLSRTDPNVFTFSTQVASGSTVAWSLRGLDVGQFVTDTSKLDVYPMRLTVSDPSTGHEIAQQTTFVVYTPKHPNAAENPKKTKVSWVLPLIDEPHRVQNDTINTFRDNGLDGEFESGGRLFNILSAVANSSKVKVAWAVDPSLVMDARTMATGYKVGDKGKVQTSTPAHNWLQMLGGLVSPTSYFTVPYADPDAAALVGMHSRQMSGLLDAAIAKEQQVPALLGRQPMQVVWPVDGVGDLRTLGRLAPKGSRSALLLSSEQLVSDVTDQKYTPNATASLKVNGKRAAVAYDATISADISGDSSTPAGAYQDEQAFLADTAMISGEEPSVQRSVVVAPDRHWNPQYDLAAKLVKDTGDAPWMNPVDLQSVIKAPATQERSLAAYPTDEGNKELPPSYLDNIASGAITPAGTLAALYVQPRDDFADGVLRAASSAFRDGSPAGPSYAGDLIGKIKHKLDQVHILHTTSQVMATRSGQLPWTIANDLPETVRVKLQVASKFPERLDIRAKSQSMTVTLGPNSKPSFYIDMHASANGSTPVSVSLSAPNASEPFDTQVTTVNTTGYAQPALIIIGVGLAVLFVGVGVRARRARKRRKLAEENEHAAGNPATDGERHPT